MALGYTKGMKIDFISEVHMTTMLQKILRSYPQLQGCRIFYFGSRISGANTPSSDIDIGIEGPTSVPRYIMARIRDDIDNLPTLYTIDVVDFTRTSEQFKKIAYMHTEDILTPDSWKNIPTFLNN